MRVAIVNIITPLLLRKFKQNRIERIIYLEISPEVNFESLSSNFQLIYAFKNFTEINNVSFDLVRDGLIQLNNKIPNLFKYKEYDLMEGLAKDVFWGLYENNAILYQINKLKGSGIEKIYDYYSRKPIIKRLALFKKLFIGKNQLYKFNLGTISNLSDSTIAFRINEFEMLEMYGDLIKNLKNESIVSFQNILRTNAEEIHSGLHKIFRINYKCEVRPVTKNTISFSRRLKLLFSKVDADFLNVTADGMFKLINHIEEYEKLAKLGIRRFFVAAAENEGEGNVLCQVAKKYNGITYNYMNGAKGKEHNNIRTDFTYWFMPDQSTQKLILSYCNVSKNQVPVTGHLLEEKAKNYKYSGTLDSFSRFTNEKKIIAVFSSPVHKKEQMDTLNFLKEYLNENVDCVVLIRKHPFDLRPNIPVHERIILLPIFEGDLYNLSLFDLFLKSDLTISFSSTVSLQSTWFSLPTLNIEFASKSLLPYVDNKKIMHVDSIERLEILLELFVGQKQMLEISHEFIEVSANIIKFLKIPLPMN